VNADEGQFEVAGVLHVVQKLSKINAPFFGAMRGRAVLCNCAHRVGYRVMRPGNRILNRTQKHCAYC
jgi:hypothetical protein